MEALLVFVAVVVIFGLPILAIIIAGRTSSRLYDLEQQLKQLRSDLRSSAARSERSAPTTICPADQHAQTIGAQPLAPEPALSVMDAPSPCEASFPEEEFTAPPSAPDTLHTDTGEPMPTGAARPAASRRFEEQVGTRLPVWIGSVALFLAGAFLVKYTFEAGLLTPKTRVILGGVFGLALLAAGEWLRTRNARIAQGVTAAGVADLFASLLATYNLYHLLGPTTGFTLFAMNTGLAVLLSLRQGPFVALLGLIGGFMTPALIGSVEPRPGPLFGYLFALQLGLLAVIRRRRWWPLAALTMLASPAWVAVWLAMNYRPEHSIWIGPFLIGSVVLFVGSLYRTAGESAAEAKLERSLSCAGVLAGLLMLALLVNAGNFSNTDWLFLGLLGAGLMVLGCLDARYELLPWLAAAAGVALLIAWRILSDPWNTARFAGVTLGLGTLYALGAYAAMWAAKRPGLWAGLSGAAAIAHFLLAYWALPEPLFASSWGVSCVLLAAIYVALSAPVIWRRETAAAYDAALGALLAAATVFVSLAMPIELERAWIAVAWALEIPALALIAGRLRVPVLRVLAAGLAVLTTIWLFQPGALRYPLEPGSFFDWILYGYGISALALAAGAWLFRRQDATLLAGALQGGALLFVFALVTLKIRHFFSPAGLIAERPDLREWSTYVSAWIVLGTAFLCFSRGPQGKVLRAAANIALFLAGLAAVLALCLAYNPLWHRESVGAQRIVNWLLYMYGLPAMLAAVSAGVALRLGDRPLARAAGAGGLLLLFVLVSLEVTQWFRGEYLQTGACSAAESYSYSAAWVALGTLLLLVGILTRGVVLRWASLAVMLLAVGKVFLYDTAHLRDLYRVFSFLGLGLSLLLLAFLYQRFVFAREPRSPGYP